MENKRNYYESLNIVDKTFNDFWSKFFMFSYIFLKDLIKNIYFWLFAVILPALFMIFLISIDIAGDALIHDTNPVVEPLTYIDLIIYGIILPLLIMTLFILPLFILKIRKNNLIKRIALMGLTKEKIVIYLYMLVIPILIVLFSLNIFAFAKVGEFWGDKQVNDFDMFIDFKKISWYLIPFICVSIIPLLLIGIYMGMKFTSTRALQGFTIFLIVVSAFISLLSTPLQESTNLKTYEQALVFLYLISPISIIIKPIASASHVNLYTNQEVFEIIGISISLCTSVVLSSLLFWKYDKYISFSGIR